MAAELPAADLTILLQRHEDYDLDFIVRTASRLFDTSGQAGGPNVALL